MIRTAFGVVGLAMVCAGSAMADTNQLFAVSGNFYEYDASGNSFAGGSITGTETIDLTQGTIIGSSLQAVAYGVSYSFGGVPISQGAQANSAAPDDPSQTPLAYQAIFSDGTNQLDLNLAIDGDLVGYSGGAVCSFDWGSCGGGNTSYFSFLQIPGEDSPVFVNDGTLTPVVTPEPSSLVLLGTGVLGLAGAVRRRVWRTER